MTIKQWEEQLQPTLINNIETILKHLNPTGVFFDVGANIGLITKAVLNRYPDLRCYLFEPVGDLYEHCKYLFPQPNITVEQLVLSNFEGRIGMQINPENLGDNRVSGQVTEGGYETTTLTNYIKKNNIGKVDFIKIDCEGHDVQVVKGLMPYLDETPYRPFIYYEHSWMKNESFQIAEHIAKTYSYTYDHGEYEILLIPPVT